MQQASLKSPLEATNLGQINLVVIQATPFCNIDCDYCYLPDRSSKQTLSIDLLEPIFRNLFSSPLLGDELTVCWHAGEPLSVPISFYESTFEKLSKVDTEFNLENCIVNHSIQTNATLLNQRWCDLISEYKIQVGVSLDGPALIHDSHRKTRSGLGTHASVMRGVQLLQKNNIDFHAIAVITQDSLDYPDEIFQFFWENGIKEVGVNAEEIEGINRSSSLEKSGTIQRYAAFMHRLWELTKATKGEFKLREFERICPLIYTGEILDSTELTLPFSIITIDVNGNFSTYSPELLTMPSAEYGGFLLGNVLRDTFDSVIATEHFQRIHQDIQTGVENCRSTCEYFSLCGGGSPSNKYSETGSFKSMETMHCRYTIKTLTDIILNDVEAQIRNISTAR
ncbi:cyclophane-forming radical SAM/SPASM peptide maturase GrrM/OscB [Tumidithrix elongata RA019]|uniref:Cyclophane-forming radical SAM/SPASM peptide maturase GrrM/OscB n=1 Tax=Tumidithrix elongata BACA0141 TaxID=2716417 RepID=A0AAW9Q018_9CYAN|nr:cyclophane-forming radical SAM/SPASM peptide maturase GrrM/OscB [Tumidithrix elongata RA019]